MKSGRNHTSGKRPTQGSGFAASDSWHGGRADGNDLATRTPAIGDGISASPPLDTPGRRRHDSVRPGHLAWWFARSAWRTNERSPLG
jgi:hypothetical protein